MKQLVAFSTVLLFIVSCSSNKVKEGFQINCEIAGMDSTQAILLKPGEENNYIGLDSTEIKEGKFEFSGKLDYPQLLFIEIKGLKSKIKLFAENSVINLIIDKDSLETPKISGSSVQADYERFMNIISPYEKQLEELYPLFSEAKNNKDENELRRLDSLYDNIDSVKRSLIDKFIKDNSSSIIAPYAVRKYLVYYIELEELESYVKSFDTALAKTEYYTSLNERVKTLQSVAIGKPAPDFSIEDTLGNPVSLSSFKGKYVLVDFWASWCGPCRRENPNVVAMYEKYNDKGFEVFGVSFDSKKENWLKAIKEDNLTWTHVSELKGWNNEAGKIYGIISIPHTILIDKEGIIIAKGEDTRGEKLQKKLAEILN